MPGVCACHEINPVAHVRVEENHRRLSGAAQRLCVGKRLEDSLHIVAGSDEGIPAEGFPFRFQVALARHLVHGAVNLLVIPVRHGNEPVQAVVGGEHRRFPDLSFLALPVSAHDIGEGRIFVQPLAQRDAGRGGKALPEGTGGLGDARKILPDRRMALQARSEFSECVQFLHREIARSGEEGIINRGEMTGREDEYILVFSGAGPSRRIVSHDFGK